MEGTDVLSCYHGVFVSHSVLVAEYATSQILCETMGRKESMEV